MELSLKITIPEDVNFSDLKLKKIDTTEDFAFSWTPIEKICLASDIDINLFKNAHENNVASLIITWYFEHLSLGGQPDVIADELIKETIDEIKQDKL